METIQLPVFQSSNEQTAREQKYVSFNQSATFKLNAITLILIDNAIGAYVSSLMEKLKDVDTYNKPKTVPVAEFLLSMKFKGMSPVSMDAEANFELVRAEVVVLKRFILEAMTEQEAKRDADNKFVELNGDYVNDPSYSPSFDADLYIQLKHILLDVREWLCGDVEN